MMRIVKEIHYDKLFRTPDELADHLMKPHDEQMAELAVLLAKHPEAGQIVCDLPEHSVLAANSARKRARLKGIEATCIIAGETA